MKSAIRVENLSKSYRLGRRSAGSYRTLRETITDSVAGAWHRLRRRGGGSGNGSAKDEDFWALQDVSFEVQPGEVVGIIGRNGAGKSTLLKILSRIVEPAAGRAEVRGRMGSLLEVGTGFHPELTGRENVYLNGSVLGMSRKEIDRQFDEIVAFAEIERFLDTPVKRYSSGMYVRLAFAVAAHLQPEILVVDEVLAVGDAVFQKKCLSKMRDAGRNGRTVLFVSHNLGALQSLCGRGIVLERGHLVQDATVQEAVRHYLGRIEMAASTDLAKRTDRRGAGRIRLRKVEIASDGGSEPGQVVMGRPARFLFRWEPALSGVTCRFTVFDAGGLGVARFNSALGNPDDTSGRASEDAVLCTIEEMLLAPGRYRIDVSLLAAGEIQDSIEAAAYFNVVRGTVRGREPPPLIQSWVVCLPHLWQNYAHSSLSEKASESL